MLFAGKRIEKELNRAIFLTAQSNRDISEIKYAGSIEITINAQNNFLSDRWRHKLEIQVDEQDNFFMREVEEKDPEDTDPDFTFIHGEDL